jgi:hypothetical protein
VGIERNGRKEDDDRFVQCIGGFYRYIERRIVDAALGPLHPVDNAKTRGIWIARAPDGNTGSLERFAIESMQLAM